MFRPHPHDPDRADNRTDAQKVANARSFRIFRLRGLHSQMGLLTGWRAKAARWLCDRELNAIGAEGETMRQAARRAKWSKEP